MGETKKIGRPVTVAGKTYQPGDEVPADIAEKIRNPKAFVPLDEGFAEDEDRPAGTSSGARLATAVTVGGVTYGPDDPIPDDVAAKITNPKVWEGGRRPTAGQADKATAPTGDGEDGDQAPAGGESTEGESGDDEPAKAPARKARQTRS